MLLFNKHGVIIHFLIGGGISGKLMLNGLLTNNCRLCAVYQV